MTTIACPNCSMQFSSAGLMYKHQSKFCVGGNQRLSQRDDNKFLDKQLYSSRSSESSGRIQQLQLQADHHGRNLQGLKSRQQLLEHQRYEIDKRLGQLSRPGKKHPLYTQSEGRIAGELQYHEDRNQKQLNELRTRLRQLQANRSNLVGTVLLPEIITMRQAYLSQGGANPSILAQMSELEDEARAEPVVNHQIRAYEQENQRLQNQIHLLQEEQNNRTARDSGRQDTEYLRRLADLEKQMHYIKQDTDRDKPIKSDPFLRQRAISRDYTPSRRSLSDSPPLRRPPFLEAKAKTDRTDVPYLFNGHQSADADNDPLNPAPYDEMAGFTIFYDFTIGLDSSTQSVRLITCLYNKETQYGEPTTLPNIQTEPQSHSYYKQGGQMATMSLKQVVSNCASMRDLTVIIELQTATSSTSGHKPARGRMMSRAWTKLDLFDLHGQLISGRWRTPLRMTPVKPNLSTSDLKSVTQYGSVEMFVRLVNQRDADVQLTSVVTPANTNRYHAQPQGLYSAQRSNGRRYSDNDSLHSVALPAERSRSPSPAATRMAKKRVRGL